VDLGEVLATGRYNPVAAAESEGWAEELAGGHTPETEEYGIRSLTYTAERPFHPERLVEALSQLRGMLRSKGFCWLATRSDLAAIWSQAGPNLTFEPAAWWSSLEVPAGQEIVFIGIELDLDHIRRLLDAALLTDTEFATGPTTWSTYPDPFPTWGNLHDHH